MDMRRIVFYTICLLVTVTPYTPGSAAEPEGLPIFCLGYRAEAVNEEGYRLRDQEISMRWMRISFATHLVWPEDCQGFNSASLGYEWSDDHEFGVVSVVDGEFQVIGTSRLPLLPPDSNGASPGQGADDLFILPQECAEYLMRNVARSRNPENIRFDSGWMANEVHYCRNQFGQTIYSRCDLDHRYLVIKYGRTRFGQVPYAWRFYRIDFLTGANETAQALVPVQAGYFLELPFQTDTWDLYWAYLIGDSAGMYDPTLYHEWWTFVSFFEFPAYEANDATRPIFYVSDMIPASVADFYEISKFGMFDSAG
jgi:hypothetical protein